MVHQMIWRKESKKEERQDMVGDTTMHFMNIIVKIETM